MYLTICICLVLQLSYANAQCADLDTDACVRMMANEPDLCNTQVGEQSCLNYCGLCPDTGTDTFTAMPPMMTTTIPSTVMTTAAPCDDIDPTACQLMHKNRPDLCADPVLSVSACKRFCGLCPVECFTCPSLVQDMTECNQTIMCTVQQDCYTMEVFDFDQSHGFRGGCMSKDMCVPSVAGPDIVGRSSSTVHTTCCDTDRCNGPQRTVTVAEPLVDPATVRTSSSPVATHRDFQQKTASRLYPALTYRIVDSK